MKVETGNDYGAVRQNHVECSGAPWIDNVTFCDQEAIDMWIGRAEGHGPAVHVIFTKEEWEIIKNRGDAAFAGTDPNLSEFYQRVG